MVQSSAPSVDARRRRPVDLLGRDDLAIWWGLQCCRWSNNNNKRLWLDFEGPTMKETPEGAWATDGNP
jgi:hypothetical protein